MTRRLRLALAEDGPAQSISADPLLVAWTAGVRAHQSLDSVSVLDGHPDVSALARELGLPGLGPAEALQGGYASFGETLLDRLVGEYSLVTWSGSGHGLLARDRVGARPLFLMESDGTLLFASEIRNLIALLPSRPLPDALAVSDWLTGAQTRENRTLYDGIRVLPAGHAIRLRQGSWEQFRHWSPGYVPPQDIDFPQAATAIRAGLTRAVSRALDGAKRPAVMLSGGFDSAAVSAVAATVPGSRRVRAYSAVFPTMPTVDESQRIARVRDWIGLAGVEVQFRAGSALGAALEFLSVWQVPSATPNLFIWLPLLRRGAADGVDVMLDGEGGDELFGCAQYLLADRLALGRPLDALGIARRLPGMGSRPQAKWLLRAMTKYAVRGALPYTPHQWLRRSRARSLPGWLSAQTATEHRRRDDPWAWKREGRPWWWVHLRDLLTSQSDAMGTSDQFRREGRLAGLTLRHPLRDPELIELVLTHPPELGFDPHLDRPVARRALRGVLPQDVLVNDEKAYFNAVLDAALRGRDFEALRRLLGDLHPGLGPHVRQSRLGSLREGRADARAAPWASQAWRLASLELWLDYQMRPERVERVREALDSVPALAFVYHHARPAWATGH